MNEERAKAAEALDMSAVDQAVREHGAGADAVIPILQAIQRHYRYLPQDALKRVCETTEITPASITGVSTFYSQFRHAPVGKHIISICHGTACHVKGAELIHDALARHLKLESGQDTDAQGLFTVQRVACLGCCTLAPVMQIDGVTYGHLTSETVGKALEDFLKLAKKGPVQRDRSSFSSTSAGLAEIRVGQGSCCVAGGSGKLGAELQRALRQVGAGAVIKPVGCVGMCHQTPMVEIVEAAGKSTLYAGVKPSDAGRIVRQHFSGSPLRRVIAKASGALENLLVDESWNPVTRYAVDVRESPICTFLGPQRRIATEFGGALDPLDAEEYSRHGGFEALRACFQERNANSVIEKITCSGLRGRGGAGFPTGQKWRAVRDAAGDTKYIILNGDEGDPGAFMDRMLLESYPYRILEGMIIAAYAVGATRGFLYVRAEYPLALKRVREAMVALEARNMLGKDILGSGFSLSLEVKEGAGAFVSGEETALIAALEGRRSTPRLRPPYPAIQGLWGKPTNINNVETYALVPWILRNGHEAFAALGTGSSRGTKVFSLAGKVRRGGLIEVPMGVTIRQVVEEIGGGAVEGRTFKAVQIGGPSGACIPAAMADTPIDYESLTGVGGIMGSGGLVVIDDTDCMVDIARYFLRFTRDESCGKCAPCRIGTYRMLEILDRLCDGKAKAGDLEALEELAHSVKKGSLCGLGQTAPNPVLSTLKCFRDEYEAHVAGKCPAHRCRALIKYSVTDDCTGCTICAQQCPVDAIPLTPYVKHEIDQEKCTRCDTCRRVCPEDAVRVD